MTGGYTAAVLLISINEKWLQTRWATSRQIKSHHHGLNNITSTVIKLEAKRYAQTCTRWNGPSKNWWLLYRAALWRSPTRAITKTESLTESLVRRKGKQFVPTGDRSKYSAFHPLGSISSQLSWQSQIWVIKLLQLVLSRSHWQAKLHRTTYNAQTHC